MSVTTALALTTDPSLAAGGDATARAPDGRVVFIEGAAPAERVEVEVTKTTKSYLRARVTRVLEPSIYRVDPPCPHAETCGGCSLQHVSAEAQTASKHQGVVELLRRVGGVDLSSVELLPPAAVPPYGYRGRVRLALAPDGSLGYRAQASRRVVAIESCVVLTPPLEAALQVLRAVLGPARPKGVVEVSMVATEPVAVALPPGFGAYAKGLRSAGLVVLSPSDPPLTESDAIGPLAVRPEQFAQSGALGNALLLAHVDASIPSVASALELYAGSGNFTRLLARRAAKVTAIESDARSAGMLRGLALPKVKVVVGDVAKSEAWAQDANLILVDPPRAGLDPEVIAGLVAHRATKLVYVSCDPGTFARDVARLAPWRLTRLRAFDIYPQTPHVELVAELAR